MNPVSKLYKITRKVLGLPFSARITRRLREISDYRRALDQSCSVAVTDSKGRILHANNNFCAVSGYSRGELLGQDHRIINSGYHSHRFFKDLWETIRIGKIWKGEIRNKRKNGEFYWSDTTIVPFLDEKGQPYQYMAIRSDITGRKMAEKREQRLREEVRQREQKFADVLERINEGFIMLDRNYNYIYVNKKIGQITHRDPAQLTGKNIWLEFPEAVGSATWKAITGAMSTGSFQYCLDYFSPLDLWHENFVYPSEDGLSIFIRDITSQKKAEEQIRNSEKIYKTIASNIPGSLICILDNNLKYTFIEGDLLEKLGYSRTKLLDNKISEVLPPERLNMIMPFLERAFTGETVITEASLNDYDVQYRFVPLKKDDGAVYAAMIAGFDITAIRAHQKHVEAMNIELGKQVKERTQELEILNKELESFSYSVAHDLRTPLRAIRGYSSLIVEDYGQQLDEEGNRWISKLQASATRMGQLIDDLLALSRLGRQKPVMSPVNMKEQIMAALAELDTATTDIRLGTLHNVTGDPSLIKQVLLNLISNAIKYSSKKEQPVVIISSELKDSTVTYSVSDNGAGFDMKYYDKLFGVFQRLHNETEYPGTGVGLALTQRIIKKHDGKIWATGERGQGATFYFTLQKDSAA